MNRTPPARHTATGVGVQRWRPARHVRITRLSTGGCVLVDWSDLSCHELDDAAAILLAQGEITADAEEDEAEFVAHCLAARWIIPIENR